MSERPRVLVVTNLWPEHGGFRGIFVREQVDALRAIGCDIDVEVVAQDRGRADYLRAAPRVRARARSGEYDLVHIHYGLTSLAARLVAVPRVLTLHGSDVRVPWQAMSTRLGAGGVATRIYVSRSLAEAAGDPDGLVIPGGVDFDLFRPVPREQARVRLGLPAAGPVALFGASPAQALKRYGVFRAVLDLLRRRGLPVTELILAERDQPRSAVPLKFAAADVLLFTSLREGSPGVVKEAAVMGLPVVTTAVGDVAEVLAGVHPSAIVPVDGGVPTGTPEAEATAELVRQLADRVEPLLRDPVRSNGRERLAWLDGTRIAERVASVYRDVLARSAAGAGRG